MKKRSSAHRVLLSLGENIDISLSFSAHKDEIKSRRVAKQKQNNIKRARTKYLFNNLADDDRIWERIIEFGLGSLQNFYHHRICSLMLTFFFLLLTNSFELENLILLSDFHFSVLVFSKKKQQICCNRNKMFYEIFSNFRLQQIVLKLIISAVHTQQSTERWCEYLYYYKFVKLRLELALLLLTPVNTTTTLNYYLFSVACNSVQRAKIENIRRE